MELFIFQFVKIIRTIIFLLKSFDVENFILQFLSLRAHQALLILILPELLNNIDS